MTLWAGLVRAWRRATCRHNHVELVRWHPTLLPQPWKGRVLYTDKHKVANLVRCVKCGEILKGSHPERVYAQSEE